MLTQEMLDSIKRVEASRPQRIGAELKRMSAQEKDELLRRFHPDYRQDGFVYLAVGPNKGDRFPRSWATCCTAKAAFWARM